MLYIVFTSLLCVMCLSFDYLKYSLLQVIRQALFALFF
nr:MAG TPA: hypothetical protein [Caudoviricetes sp.]